MKGRDSLLAISVGGFIVLVDQGQNVILEIHCFAGGRSEVDVVLQCSSVKWVPIPKSLSCLDGMFIEPQDSEIDKRLTSIPAYNHSRLDDSSTTGYFHKH